MPGSTAAAYASMSGGYRPWMTVAVGLLLVVTTPPAVVGYSRGVPVSGLMCEQMMPHHGVGPQPLQDNAYVMIAASNCYNGQDRVRVHFFSKRDACEELEGVFLQAKEPGVPTTNYGTWDTLGHERLQTKNCFDRPDSSVSHAGALENTHNLTVEWIPPQDYSQEIEFVATLVRSKHRFWHNVSTIITYDSSCTAGTPTSPLPLPCGAPIPSSASHSAQNFKTVISFVFVVTMCLLFMI